MSMIADPTDGKIDLAALAQPTQQIQECLNQFLRERPLPGNLTSAIRYSLLGQGKCLRPILVAQACQSVGGSVDQAITPAAAIEMIHCFSLVHDDLPAMDDDDLRRGRPTLHKHTNEAMAVLAGDGMLGLAFELVSLRVKPASLALNITKELSIATNNMIAGQVYDTLPSFGDDVDPMTRLQLTHRNKTGALIRGSCRIGAMCGEADADQLTALTKYGEAVGLMFQIVDDLLDVTSTADQLGKAAKKDAEHGKLTYPGICGIDGSHQEVDRLRQSGIEALNIFGPEAESLRALCEYMAVRTN